MHDTLWDKDTRPSDAHAAYHEHALLKGKYVHSVLTIILEMTPVQDLQTWLPASVKLVHLPPDVSGENSARQDYLIRSQPALACMSTMEAVARSAYLSSQLYVP